MALQSTSAFYTLWIKVAREIIEQVASASPGTVATEKKITEQENIPNSLQQQLTQAPNSNASASPAEVYSSVSVSSTKPAGMAFPSSKAGGLAGKVGYLNQLPEIPASSSWRTTAIFAVVVVALLAYLYSKVLSNSQPQK